MISQESAAKAAILQRIGAALGPGPVAAGEPPRAYRQASDAHGAEHLEWLIDRLEDYKAGVRRCDRDGLRATINAALEARSVRRLVVPPDWPDDWGPDGVELLRDGGLSVAEIEAADGVATGCALAIAQTGTIVLDAGAAQGRRLLSLLPDYHLCIVFAEQVVGLVPEGVTRLHSAATRPLTWISGPSATSDIELNRVEGVHGPRTLEVIIVGERT